MAIFVKMCQGLFQKLNARCMDILGVFFTLFWPFLTLFWSFFMIFDDFGPLFDMDLFRLCKSCVLPCWCICLLTTLFGCLWIGILIGWLKGSKNTVLTESGHFSISEFFQVFVILTWIWQISVIFVIFDMFWTWFWHGFGHGIWSCIK